MGVVEIVGISMIFRFIFTLLLILLDFHMHLYNFILIFNFYLN